MNLEEALQGIEGWFYPGEAQMLHDLVAALQLPQMYLEVGSYRGRSLIAAALGAGVPCFGVDPHVMAPGDPFEFGDADRVALMENLLKTGVAWKVRLLDIQSECAAKGWPGHRIGVLLIDGAHSVDAVTLDLESWLPFVDDGAFVLFHDANTDCVIGAVQGRTDLEFVRQVDLTAQYIYHKPEPQPEGIDLLASHRWEGHSLVPVAGTTTADLVETPVPEAPKPTVKKPALKPKPRSKK